MNAQIWIGFGFLVALVAFLLYAFLRFEDLSPSRQKQIKFLSALCAAMAGAFISGETVFEAASTTPTGKIALQGTAGFALFWGVFLMYDRGFRPRDEFEFNLPPGATFLQTVEAAAQLARVAVDMGSLTRDELAAPMASGHVRAAKLAELFAILRLKTATTNAVRRYSVVKSEGIYTLKPE